MSSSSASATASATSASSSSSLTNASDHPPSFKIIGLILAIASGLFIGISFVFKKKGLLKSQQKEAGMVVNPGEGHAYLKSPMWWTGMILMIVGEICNFVAYAFAEAILVTPMGAISVVVTAILSSIFLKEKLTFFGKIGCALCIVGATIIALNSPEEQTTADIPSFQKLFLSPGFLVWASLMIVGAFIIIFFVAPRWGKKNMLVYISVCSVIGGISVSCTQGLGSSIITSIRGDNQFKHWFIYFLLGFVVITLLTEINYLNKALELFNTALVVPTYYTTFTLATLVTSSILYQGFKAPPAKIVTVVLGFLTIVGGIALLQLSKIDTETIEHTLDRRSTLLVKAAKAEVQTSDDEEKNLTSLEEPGIDSVRGSFGAVGSIHRALSQRKAIRDRRTSQASSRVYRASGVGLEEIPRYQLYDHPMPKDYQERISMHSGTSPGTLRSHHQVVASPPVMSPSAESANKSSLSLPISPGRQRSPSVKFAGSETTHQYAPPDMPQVPAIHDTHARDEKSPPTSPTLLGFDPSRLGGQPPARMQTTVSSELPEYEPELKDDFGEVQHASYRDPFEPGGTTRYGSKSATLPKRAPTLASMLASQFSSSTPDLNEELERERESHNSSSQRPSSAGRLGNKHGQSNSFNMSTHRPHFPRIPSRAHTNDDDVEAHEELLSGRRNDGGSEDGKKDSP